MLQDLENFKKLFVEKYNERAQANIAKAASAPKTSERMPKKRAHGGGSNRGAPPKGPFCQVLQVVQEHKWALYHPRYHQVL
jgi:hypothetical protein